MLTDLNELATIIHQQCVDAGWWVDMNRDIYQTLQLVSTKLAEATEGERKNLMDDHLPHRKMGEVKLADALIRLLDLAGRYGWVRKYFGSKYRHHRVGEMVTIAGMHFICTIDLSKLGESILNQHPQNDVNLCYAILIDDILKVGELQGYDIMSALHEKLEYNKHRLDHKPEVRAGEHGKKF